MTLKTLCIALMVCAALPCSAKESAEVRQAYLEQTREIAGLLAIGWLCQQAGYTVDPDIVPKTIEPAVFQAEKDGMSFSDATDIVSAATNTANAEEQARTDGYLGSGDVKAWFAHVDGKCRAYAALPAYAPYIKAPADPDNKAGYTAFTTWADSLIKGPEQPSVQQGEI